MHIGVIAILKAKQNHQKSLFEKLQYLHEMTHKHDEGCIQYDLHQDLENKDTFIFVETWQNAEYLAQHQIKEHYLESLQQIEDLVESVTVHKTEQKL